LKFGLFLVAVRQKFGIAVDRMVGDALQLAFKPGIWFDATHLLDAQ
jgi:hypothetical protein